MNLDPSAFIADPDLILALERRSTSICCDEDRELFNQGDNPQGLYILNFGKITLSMTSPNREPLMSVEAPAGSLLGLPGLISGEPYTLSAVAHSGARISFVTRGEFTRQMQSDPQLALRILQVLAAEVRSARHALANL